MNTDKIKVIAFDADDTLWDCQGHFEVVMQHLYDELVPWVDRETAALELFATERKNMRLLGYGVKAFTLSMLETAMRVSRNEMPAATINDILQRCYSLLEFPCTPLPEVEETLKALRRPQSSPLSNKSGDRAQSSPLPKMSGQITPLSKRSGQFTPLSKMSGDIGKSSPPSEGSGEAPLLVCFTKGELLDQEHKLERSGLAHYFDHVEITSDKGEPEFRALCEKLSVSPDEMLMVGNSLKSDIAPAIAIGCLAVYIPFHVTWQLEHHDHFEHPRMVQIEHFSQLLDVLKLSTLR